MCDAFAADATGPAGFVPCRLPRSPHARRSALASMSIALDFQDRCSLHVGAGYFTKPESAKLVCWQFGTLCDHAQTLRSESSLRSPGPLSPYALSPGSCHV